MRRAGWRDQGERFSAGVRFFFSSANVGLLAGKERGRQVMSFASRVM